MRSRWIALLAGLVLFSLPVHAAGITGDAGASAFRAGSLIEFKAPEPVRLVSPDEMGLMFDAMSEYSREEESLVINHGTYFYYYEHLDPVAREMYDIMLEVAKDPVSEENYGLMMTTIDPDSEEFFDKWCLAYLGLTYDHPELFWLYSYHRMVVPYSDGDYANGVYYVLFGMDEPYLEYEQEMTAFNQAANAFLSDIDTNSSDEEIIRQIHDKLVGMVSYDDDEAAGLVDDPYAHTAYSMFVNNSRGIDHYGVCDGYSLAFEYVLQQCGIKVVFNAGMAGSPEDEAAGTLGGHAWNMVMLDDVWYEIDSTWDDNIMEDLSEMAGEYELELTPGNYPDDYILEAFHDTQYRYELDHFLYLLSTEELRHFFVTEHENLYFTTGDGQLTFSILEGNDSVHVRFEPGSGPQGNLLNLAPVAELEWQG